jgi:hypothetical protein
MQRSFFKSVLLLMAPSIALVLLLPARTQAAVDDVSKVDIAKSFKRQLQTLATVSQPDGSVHQPDSQDVTTVSTVSTALDEVAFDAQLQELSMSSNVATDDVLAISARGQGETFEHHNRYRVTSDVTIAPSDPHVYPDSSFLIESIDAIAISSDELTFIPQLQFTEADEFNNFASGNTWYLAQDHSEADQTDDELYEIDAGAVEEEDAGAIEDQEERAWQFEFTPYVFFPLNVQGSGTVDGITADLDLDLGDILDVLSFAASGRFEAWNRNRFGIIVEGNYLELNARDERLLEGPLGLLSLNVEADVTYEQAYFDLAFGYRTEIDDGNDEDRTTQAGLPDGNFDIIAGLRVQHLSQTIDLDFELAGPRNSFAFSRNLGDSETWVEPLLGFRLGYNASPRLSIATRFDISGFGIDGLSLTYRALVGLDWVFAGDTSLKVGYGLYGFEYETGEGRDEFGTDQLQHGPYLAVTFRF